MSFYKNHAPINTQKIKLMNVMKLVGPIVLMISFVWIMYSLKLKLHLSTPFFDLANIISILFVSIIIVDIFMLKYISQRIYKQEYLRKYGRKIEGTITNTTAFPSKTVEVEFSGRKSVKKLSSNDTTKYTIGEKCSISYNPEDLDDFVII